jgi:hypothetical protein
VQEETPDMLYKTIRRMDTKSKLGKRMIEALISEKTQKRLSIRLMDISTARMINKYCNKEEASLKALFQTCLKHISPITTPPVLMSQIPHSGGSLLNNFFDGHHEIHAYPNALMNSIPAKILWTEIKPKDDPQPWIDFFLDYLGDQSRPSIFKMDTDQKVAIPIVFLPLLQKQIFIRYLNTIKLIKLRDVFDAYMTSCFGAWLNYQNHGLHKKFVTGLAPGVVTMKKNMEVFFNNFPNGRFICLVANPQNWYESVLQAEPGRYTDVKRSMMCWKESLHTARWSKDHFPDRTCLIKIEDLVNNTEAVMRYLADFLGLQYDPILLKPTFNGYPISADSRSESGKVKPVKRLSREAPALSDTQSKIITEITEHDYQNFLTETVCFNDTSPSEC